jgi:hypothetical protein
MKYLSSLSVEGNLFRVPRRAILERGTDYVKTYLLERM